MDVDPVAATTLAVLVGGGSGGLVSWWIKGVIEQTWKQRARDLDAKVAEQAKESEQLRAYVLEIRSERHRRFDEREEEAAREFAAECRARARRVFTLMFDESLSTKAFFEPLEGLVEMEERCGAVASPDVKAQLRALKASLSTLASTVCSLSRGRPVPTDLDYEVVVDAVFAEADRLEDIVKPSFLPDPGKGPCLDGGAVVANGG